MASRGFLRRKRGEQYLLDWKGRPRAARTPIEKFFYFAGPCRHGTRAMRTAKASTSITSFTFTLAGPIKRRMVKSMARLAADPTARGWRTGKMETARPIVMGPIARAAERLHCRSHRPIACFDPGARGMQDSFGDLRLVAFRRGGLTTAISGTPKRRSTTRTPRAIRFFTPTSADTQHWWNYLRSGERKFFDWAFAVGEPLGRYRGGARADQVSPPTIAAAKSISPPCSGRAATGPLTAPFITCAITTPVKPGYAANHSSGRPIIARLETTTLAYYLTGDETLQRGHRILAGLLGPIWRVQPARSKVVSTVASRAGLVSPDQGG